MTRADEPSDRPEIGSDDRQVSPTARWEMPRPRTAPDGETPPEPADAPSADPVTMPTPAAVAPVGWTGRERGVAPVPAAGPRPAGTHWPRAAERRAAARQAGEDRAATQRAADDHAALLATARRAAATRDATNRAARRAAECQSTRGRIRRFRTPVAAAVLGVAVVAATGTADTPVESPRSLLEPPSAPPAGVLPGPGVVPPVMASPARTTLPSTPDSVRPFSTAPDAGAGYGSGPLSVQPASVATALPDERARTALRVAMSQIGLPYVWGGDGPQAGDAGFDCSGLTHFAYGESGIDLPRTAHTQFRAGPRVPDGSPLQPGDLVFYGTYRKVHHVGMYIGQGRMVNAPTFGQPVQTAWYRWNGDDYIGATRPASSELGSAPLTDVPAEPDPDEPPTRDEFDAPVAPRPTAVPEPRAPQPREPDSAAESRAGSDADIAAGRVPAPPPAPSRDRRTTPHTAVPGAAPQAPATTGGAPSVLAQAPPPTERWTVTPGASPEPPEAGRPAPSTSVIAAAPSGAAPGTAPSSAASSRRPATPAPPAATAPASRSGAVSPTPPGDHATGSGNPPPTAPPAPSARQPAGPAVAPPPASATPTREPAGPTTQPAGPTTPSTEAATPLTTTVAAAAPPVGVAPELPSDVTATTNPSGVTTGLHPGPTTPPTIASATSLPPAHPSPAPMTSTTPAPPPAPTPPPRTPPSVAARPPSTPTASASAPSTTRPPASASGVDALLVVGSTRLPTTPVGAGFGGLPAGPGVLHRAAGWIVQLRAPLATAPGTAVTLRLPDGRTLRWSVESRSAPGPRSAATASDAPLTLLVPADRGRWIVVTAR